MRRRSMPVNLIQPEITDMDTSSLLSICERKDLTEIEHFEMLITEMKDLSNYAEEILKAIKEKHQTNNTNEFLSSVAANYINLVNKINFLKVENTKLFEEVFKYINDCHILIDSEILTSDTLLNK